MARGVIELKGVRVHNLRIDSLRIPRGEFIVLTGVSGSGKSSLAFSTLYAEGQRRYVQSLSSYARQFLGRLPKPDADFIRGIPPSIIIEQRVSNRNPRSTVGTVSEIYEYLRLLYARVGRIISPVSGQEVRCHTVDDVVDFIRARVGARVMVLSPLAETWRTANGLRGLAEQGFSRIYAGGQLFQIDTEPARAQVQGLEGELLLLIDRFVSEDEPGLLMRCADSVDAAFRQGDGHCQLILRGEDGQDHTHSFSQRLEADGIQFERPTPLLFSFNHGVGACPLCEGYGFAKGIEERKVIPDPSRSIFDDAVVCWRGNVMQRARDAFIEEAEKVDFPIHRPYRELTEEQRRMVWEGVGRAEGINAFFEAIRHHNYKIQNRALVARFTGLTRCPECGGLRLRSEAMWIQVGGRTIGELVELPLRDLADFIRGLDLDAHDAHVARRLLQELNARLSTLIDVGLGYLTLNRAANTLSGGETQRINLATSLGSSLVGSLYILDEPSVGLHPHDTQQLISVLKRLQHKGNTVLVVEHDEDVMRAADTIIDLGPGGGCFGGRIVYIGPGSQIERCTDSLTGDYLAGRKSIPLPESRRKGNGHFIVRGIYANNIQGLDVEIPLRALTVITGVSGSGKSSLVNYALASAIQEHVSGYRAYDEALYYDHFELEGGELLAFEVMDQNALARSSRSTPVTYLDIFTPIRTLFAQQEMSSSLGLDVVDFSFNSSSGQCPECQGMGYKVVEMQFMADIEVPCDVCGGRRYNDRVLEVEYRGKTISDVLQMTADEAIPFFEGGGSPQAALICMHLAVLQEVGLGYVQLGQSTSTLSGGEAQRLKLAYYLLTPAGRQDVLFMFDEPTTGLHFDDIRKLVHVFNRLIDQGHTIVVIEHNVELMVQADHLIDLGPGAGRDGGRIVATGTPEEVAQAEGSVTAQFLRARLERGKSYDGKGNAHG